MPRMPPDELERLKQGVSLERLVERAGIQLRRHGQDLIGLCPFHDDKNPSLVISPEKNLWHCLGACQSGGSVIDWVMKRQGVSFRHAVELLRADPALVMASASAPIKSSRARALPSPVALDADDQALLNQVIDYYHATLKESPEALAYLEKRGLKDAALIDRFKLGYANRTLGLRLPTKLRADGARLRTSLTRVGLYRDSGHEHFNGCLVIPVFDEARNVTEIYGRRLQGEGKPGAVMHLYLPGPHQGVWNLNAFDDKEIILCEALIDALTFWNAGFRNVTSSYGVEGFTDDHLSALKHHGTKRVLIAYDRDEAGDSAAARLSEKLIGEGIGCYRVKFPKGMDANEYALRVQPPAQSLALVLQAAEWMGEGAEPVREEATSAVSSPSGAPRDPAPETTSSLVAAPADIEACVNGDTITIDLGERHYRIRGLAQNASLNQMKINVLIRRANAFHADQLEMNSARQRAALATHASAELNLKAEVIQKDLARVLLKLEELHEANLQKQSVSAQKTVVLSEVEKQAALDLLKSPKLLDRLLADFTACGVVGEETNKLVGYLATVSRKLDKPLAVIVQSTSAAGKSSLMDACLAFVPEEERLQYSAITGQALFYMTSTDIQHKVLALSEEEGASRAAYALKLLQSEGSLTIAAPAKDPETGKLETQPYRVEGPVMIFMTTTAIDIDDELLNRCLVLAVDEDREQTRAIHQLQREAETLEGLIAKEERQHLLKLHQNAQRLLKPLYVVNPYAKALTFPDQATRLRRDHTKYLALIRAIALVHQHQRPIKTMVHRGAAKEYIEATLDDIEVANRLAHEVLGRTLDELPPQTRRLLLLIDQMVREGCERQKLERADYRFSRRDVRDVTGWGDTQLKLHLARLTELEYVLVHRGGRGQRFVYELLYDGQGKEGQPFVPGLIDVARLRHAYDPNRSGENRQRSGSGRPPVGGQSGGGRGAQNHKIPGDQSTKHGSCDESAQNAYIDENEIAGSYLTTKRKKALA